ncbi:chromosome condensin MukBEF ATPase and DNA-binding subunit MukB [Rhodoligotrophos appendicifer]|uniref:hypothetical protein n=1 Tax=Rhodoligotrophos appendicifer TaxID=987056 RepID=UPI0011871485|nr:hypothetical protein [Rhodoligotrophos appendicifer]
MNGLSVERELGEINVKVERLEEEMREMRADLRAVRDAIVSVSGGWKILLLLGSVAGMVGALAAKVMPFLSGGR